MLTLVQKFYTSDIFKFFKLLRLKIIKIAI